MAKKKTSEEGAEATPAKQVLIQHSQTGKKVRVSAAVYASEQKRGKESTYYGWDVVTE